MCSHCDGLKTKVPVTFRREIVHMNPPLDHHANTKYIIIALTLHLENIRHFLVFSIKINEHRLCEAYLH